MAGKLDVFILNKRPELKVNYMKSNFMILRRHYISHSYASADLCYQKRLNHRKQEYSNDCLHRIVLHYKTNATAWPSGVSNGTLRRDDYISLCSSRRPVCSV